MEEIAFANVAEFIFAFEIFRRQGFVVGIFSRVAVIFFRLNQHQAHADDGADDGAEISDNGRRDKFLALGNHKGGDDEAHAERSP